MSSGARVFKELKATGGFHLLVIGETGDDGGDLLGEGKHFAKETLFLL
jgi:hypothetical protein